MQPSILLISISLCQAGPSSIGCLKARPAIIPVLLIRVAVEAGRLSSTIRPVLLYADRDLRMVYENHHRSHDRAMRRLAARFSFNVNAS